MATNLHTIQGDLTPVKNRVLVRDMYFGEQKTAGGLIISNDDGTTRGIYPRWAKVYAKGPTNNDDYNNGDWILVEHGRWTRGVKINNGNEEIEIECRPLSDIPSLIRQGKITHALVIAAFHHLSLLQT